MGPGRAAPPRVPGHPRGEAARRLDDVQHPVDARRGAAGPEEVRRGRAAAAGRLPGDEAAGEGHPAAGTRSHPRSARARRAAVRGDGQPGRGGQVAGGTGGAPSGAEEDGFTLKWTASVRTRRVRAEPDAGGRAAIWFPRSGPRSLHAVAPAAGHRFDYHGKVTYEALHQTGHAIDGARAPAYPPAWAGR